MGTAQMLAAKVTFSLGPLPRSARFPPELRAVTDHDY